MRWTITFLFIAALGGCTEKSPKTFRDCDDCPEMVVIPSGSFVMGAREYDKQARKQVEGPVKKITFSTPFAIGLYEVTYGQFKTCVDEGGCSKLPAAQGWEADDVPIAGVTWLEAQEYVQWLSKKTGQRYSLPSEAEWEYAARAGTETIYWWGDDLGEGNAHCTRCGGGDPFTGKHKAPLKVGSLKPNPFGLYDMLGNVGEMVQDCFEPSLSSIPADGTSVQYEECHKKVRRGAAFYSPGPYMTRASARTATVDSQSLPIEGFRVKKSL